MAQEKYLEGFLAKGADTDAQQQLRDCLNHAFEGVPAIPAIGLADQLISYVRDVVLPGLAAARRAAAVEARSTMAPADIATATGLSRATVSRLITEHQRNV